MVELLREIAWLKIQEDYAEGSDTTPSLQSGDGPTEHLGIMGGAEESDDGGSERIERNLSLEQYVLEVGTDDSIPVYDDRAVSRAILDLNGGLSMALDLVAELEDEIAGLEMQGEI